MSKAINKTITLTQAEWDQIDAEASERNLSKSRYIASLIGSTPPPAPAPADPPQLNSALKDEMLDYAKSVCLTSGIDLDARFAVAQANDYLPPPK